MEIEKHLNSLRPFVYNWLELQVVSMESREIFAKSRQELQVKWLLCGDHRSLY